MERNLEFTSPFRKGMTIQPRINQKGARTCWLLFLVWLVKLRYYEKVTKFEIILMLDLTFTKIPKTSHSDVVNFFETDPELALEKASTVIFKFKAFTFFVILYNFCKITKYLFKITSYIENWSASNWMPDLLSQFFVQSWQNKDEQNYTSHLKLK